MIQETMTEENETRKDTINGTSNEGYTIPALLFIIAIVFISCSVFYVNTSSAAKSENFSNLEEVTLPRSVSQKNVRIKAQPNCTMQEHITKKLQDISTELYTKNVLCMPEDVNNVKKHNVPNANIKKAAKPRGNFVIYFAVGLLMASLVAAFLDVYKVKGKPSKRKPPLTKRCSLADLTVLRHNRRESMKKDYVVEDHRVPLKLLDTLPIRE
ncbi:hypothetical protein RN001_013192 [Aquatica leii]|uniref:Transmembrane protein n=1 Tax=Aquatica leii TaxID=1421715 RepID=A0AAN7PRE7_9COLE|nr:hypothetical protein RN001_013192 [Aquatica leii]